MACGWVGDVDDGRHHQLKGKKSRSGGYHARCGWANPSTHRHHPPKQEPIREQLPRANDHHFTEWTSKVSLRQEEVEVVAVRCEVSTKRVARNGIRIYPLAEHKLSINSKKMTFQLMLVRGFLGARPACLVVRAHLIHFVGLWLVSIFRRFNYDLHLSAKWYRSNSVVVILARADRGYLRIRPSTIDALRSYTFICIQCKISKRDFCWRCNWGAITRTCLIMRRTGAQFHATSIIILNLHLQIEFVICHQINY